MNYFINLILIVLLVASPFYGLGSLFNSSVTGKNKLQQTNEINQPVSGENLIKENSPTADKVKHPIVWSVVFDLAEFRKFSKDIVVWYGDDENYVNLLDENSKEYKKHGGVEADLMNCAGYLVSGIIYVAEKPTPEAEEPQWRFKPSSETVAQDAERKIRQCAIPSNESDPDKEGIYNQAFAVAPPDKSRRKIVISNLSDTSEIFATLPEEFKKWANENVKKDSLYDRPENRLSLKNDTWTDLNGDGVIDLIQISAFTDNNKTRTSILWLSEGQWMEIVKVQSE
jgi:hypothetical protein